MSNLERLHGETKPPLRMASWSKVHASSEALHQSWEKRREVTVHSLILFDRSHGTCGRTTGVALAAHPYITQTGSATWISRLTSRLMDDRLTSPRFAVVHCRSSPSCAVQHIQRG